MATKKPRAEADVAKVKKTRSAKEAPKAKTIAKVPAKGKAAKIEPLAKRAPKVGAAAPDFTLPADDGREISLRSLRGKNVVLYFYPRDMTPGCTVEACAFRDAHDELEANDAIVLGVSRDSPATHAKFKAKEKLPFTLLSDPTGETIAAYGSWGEKKFMGRKFNGILRTTVLIDRDGKVRKIYPKVSPKEHAEEVVRDLAEL